MKLPSPVPAVKYSGLSSPNSVPSSVIAPAGVMYPTLEDPYSANHTLPSLPSATPIGSAFAVGRAYSAIAPVEGTSLPILSAWVSLNQMFPSDRVTMPCGGAWAVEIASSVIYAVKSICPILSPAASVNHIAPSGPGAIADGLLSPVGIGYSVIGPSKPHAEVRPAIAAISVAARLKPTMYACRIRSPFRVPRVPRPTERGTESNRDQHTRPIGEQRTHSRMFGRPGLFRA